MSALTKIVGGFAILAGLGVVAAVVVLKSVDVNQYKGLVADQVAEATGRKLEISGDLKLNISLTPSISVHDVRFANAAWGSRPDMMTVKRFEAEVALMPLFSGDIQVNRVVFVGLDLLLETDAKGQGNWVIGTADPAQKTAPAPAPADDGQAVLPTVHTILIKDARLTYLDGQSKSRTVLKLDKLEASAASIDAPLVLALAGSYNDHPFDGNGSLGSIKQMLGGGVLPFSATAKVGGASIVIGGEIKEPQNGKGIDLAITAKGDNLADAAALAGVSLHRIGPYDLSMRLRDSQDGYRLDGLKAKIGGSDLMGNLAVALSGARPRIDVNLGSNRLDLEDLLPPKSQGQQSGSTGAPKGASGPADGRVFPADPIPLDGLKAVDAKVSYVAKEVLAEGLRLVEVDLKLTLVNGLLTVKPLTGVFANGRIIAQAVVNGRGKTGAFSTRIKVDGLQVGAALRELKQKVYLETAMDMAFDLKGRGNSVRAIMAGLSGTTKIVGRGGKVNSQALKTVTAGIMTVLPWIKKEDNTINCVVSRFDIRKGLATSRALLFDTSGMSVAGAGKLNLRNETIDMRVNADAKSASLASLAIPVTIEGTFANPKFLPDAAAVATSAANALLGGASSAESLLGSVLGAVTGTSEPDKAAPAPARVDPCIAAIAGRKAATKTAAPVAKTPTPAPKTTVTAQPAPPPVKKEEGDLGGLLKGFGSTLDKALGVNE